MISKGKVNKRDSKEFISRTTPAVARPASSSSSSAAGGEKPTKEVSYRTTPTTSQRETSKKMTRPLSRIIISNFADDVTQFEIENLISKFVVKGQYFVNLVVDVKTKKSKGFAFVSFFQQEDALFVKNGINKLRFGYSILSTDWAVSKPWNTSFVEKKKSSSNVVEGKPFQHDKDKPIIRPITKQAIATNASQAA